MSSHSDTFTPLTVRQRLVSLTDIRLIFRICTKSTFSLKLLAIKLVVLQQPTICELEKDRCCLSHQIGFNRGRAKLVICSQSHYHNPRLRKWQKSLHYLLLPALECEGLSVVHSFCSTF